MPERLQTKKIIIEGESILYEKIVNKKIPHPFTKPIKVIKARKTLQQITLSVVVPIFNKGSVIIQFFDLLLNSLHSRFEIIVIDDASDDNSLEILLSYFELKQNLQFTILSCNTPIYETACDNLGFSIAKGEFLLEVQSDIFINDPGFDKRMIACLNKPFISSISGRCGHSWSTLLSWKFQALQSLISLRNPFLKPPVISGVGLIGPLVFSGELPNNLKPGDFYYCDTNNRGPWMIKRDTFNTVGPLDSDNFFLGDDDHDFNYRCTKFGLRSGYTPVLLSSDPGNGSTRQKRSGVNKEIYEYLKTHKFGPKKLYRQLLLARSTFPEKALL